jgi:Na+/serine symporter
MVLLSRPLIRFTRLRSQKSFLALLICLVPPMQMMKAVVKGRIGALVWARGRSFRFKVVMHCLHLSGVEGSTKSRHAPGEWRLLQIRSP